MAILTRENLRNSLKRREIAPAYLLFGSESFLRDLAAKTICDLSFGKDEVRDFNETEFSLNTPGNLATALAAANQLPMMAKRRVIKITDVKISASGRNDTMREDDEAALLEYFERPSDFCVVIFIADELDKRKKIARTLIDNVQAVDFSDLDDKDLTKWARDKIKDSGSEIDDRGLRLLVALVGPDVRRLTLEVQKLSTAALPGRFISAELVESLIGNSRATSNFDLTDHLFAGRKREAMRAMKRILDDGGEPLALLGLISSNVRRLSMAKEAMLAGADRAAVARIARVRYSDQEAFMATARRVDSKKLARAMERMAATDLAIKTSIGGPAPQGSRMQIEMLVSELASLG